MTAVTVLFPRRPESNSLYGPHILDQRKAHRRQVSLKEASKLFNSMDLSDLCAGLCLSGKCVMSVKDKCCLAVGQPEPGYGTGTGRNSPYGSDGYHSPGRRYHRNQGDAYAPEKDQPYGGGGHNSYGPNRDDSHRPNTNHGDDEYPSGDAPFYQHSAPDTDEYFRGDNSADQGSYASPSTDGPYTRPDHQEPKGRHGDEYAQTLDNGNRRPVVSQSAAASVGDAKGQALSAHHGKEPQFNGYPDYNDPWEAASDWFCWN